MTLEPHITFNGQCEAAFQFYERSLEAKIVTMLTWGNSPMAKEVPPDWHDKICHATIKIGENALAGVDLPNEQFQRPASFQLILGLEDPDEAERIFHALAESGTVTMPLRETFWSARYGILTDQFGVPWEINCAAAQKAISIFHIGLPLDHPSIPPDDRPNVAKRLADLQARMATAGYRYEIIHASPETGLDAFKHQLTTQPCDGVLIGGAVASDPDLSYFREQIIDVTHQAAPKAKIMFHNHAIDVRAIVERWFQSPS